MELSIVIPVYRESRKIAADIKAASRFLNENNLKGEIIIVDDGSGDVTVPVAKNTAEALGTDSNITVISNDQHRGKGHAVRTGVKHAKGDYIMFTDSGCCISYKSILEGLNLIKQGRCDIAHASRKLKASRILRSQSIYRQLCSKLFRWFIIHYLGISQKLTDTQCGFKIYRAEAAHDLYNHCTIDGFMFDIEVITKALRKGYLIKEFPVQWTCDRDSRLSPSRSFLSVMRQLKQIKKQTKG